ncbi:hypothetical protein FF100_32610 [Methylobacterium terricola]|uniref:Uncharacterized protein n=1 Tax=Methylobacterium terricola TaxID=2583531 RepID=A0A5C4L7D2_9HYPH|nr:hypothetical protein [Methylobacterium terricola]TNC07341.1 hypothetical protein FF100_32610 [Methylobacterium terricola]
MHEQLIVPWALHRILHDVQRCIDAKLYYPALIICLTIPEICAALTLTKEKFVKQKHYVEFVDKYTIPSQLGCDGLDCYRLRGGVVHRASFSGHPHFDASHIIFTTPETRASIHALSIVVGEKKAAIFDILMFCSAMNQAARRWFQDNKDNKLVEENLQNLIRDCPGGLPPFIGGAPVVASGL